MEMPAPMSIRRTRVLPTWLTRLQLLWRPAEKAPRQLHAQVCLQTQEPVAAVDAHYLSFSLDISVLAGGFWWEGSLGSRRGLGALRIPPLDLSSLRLDNLTRALTPAYLRVGGSEADKIHYFSAPGGEPDSLVLTQAIWDNLHTFLQRNGLKFFGRAGEEHYVRAFGCERASIQPPVPSAAATSATFFALPRPTSR